MQELMTINELARELRMSVSTIYLMLNAKCDNYDPLFPRPIRVCKSNRWLKAEIHRWLQLKMDEREMRHQPLKPTGEHNEYAAD